MKVVLDTNVIVAALRSPRGASAEVARRILRGELTMAISVPLGFEYESVCLRPEHLLAAGVRPQDAQNYVDAMIGSAEPTKVFYIWRPQLRDPSDEMVLEAAVSARAHAIVTHNIADFGGVQDKFGMDVITPQALLERMEK